MKLTEILSRNQFTLSFEVFPPKRTDAFDSIRTATEKIAALSPSFMSVTYGAGGGTSRYTLDIARNIQDSYGIPMLAHLTCVSSSRDTVLRQMEAMTAAGIENVMALRGDLTPELAQGGRSQWTYHHAVELVRELKEFNPGFCVGGACYPETHPESADQREDIRFLREKVDAGCDFLTTQMVFDNNLFYNFMYKIREAGITVPVLPGIMPITNAAQADKAVRLSGSFIPQRFKALVDMFGSSPAAMKQAGIAYATDQIIDLFANNVRNVHVYSMNKPDVAAAIMANVSDILS